MGKAAWVAALELDPSEKRVGFVWSRMCARQSVMALSCAKAASLMRLGGVERSKCVSLDEAE